MPRPLPPHPSLGHLKGQAKGILKAHRRGDPAACGVLRHLRRFGGAADGAIMAGPVALSDVQHALAVDYGFGSWPRLRRHVEFVRGSGPDGSFVSCHAGGLPEGAVLIEGLADVDWGRTAGDRQDSFMGALAGVLGAMGEPAAYQELMGLSGAAFKLLVGRPEWHPRAAHSGVGFDCPALALDALGYSDEWLDADLEDLDAGTNARIRRAVVETIDAGRPAFWLDGEFSIIAGYAARGSTFLLRSYWRGAEPGFAATGDLPWSVGLTERRGDPMPRREAVVRSLQTGVRLSRTPAIEAESAAFACGLAAYRAWIDDLLTVDGYVPPRVVRANASGYEALASARRAAAQYLGTVAEEFGPSASEALREAAAHYDRVHTALAAGRPSAVPASDAESTPAARAAEAEALEEALAHERRAVEAMERALAHVVEASGPAAAEGGRP